MKDEFDSVSGVKNYVKIRDVVSRWVKEEVTPFYNSYRLFSDEQAIEHLSNALHDAFEALQSDALSLNNDGQIYADTSKQMPFKYILGQMVVAADHPRVTQLVESISAFAETVHAGSGKKLTDSFQTLVRGSEKFNINATDGSISSYTDAFHQSSYFRPQDVSRKPS